jgi:hypothetical protein
VSYENEAGYAAPSQAYLPVDPRGPSEVLSGRGLYLAFQEGDQGGVDLVRPLLLESSDRRRRE